MATRKQPDAQQLGTLEAEVMKVLWRIGQGSVQDVLNGLPRDKDLAYTTVMTVLARLVEKRFLEREKRGRAFFYRPRVSRESIADSALRGVIDRFFDGLDSQAVAHLLGRGETLDEEELRRLEAAIRRRRKGDAP